jgi:hypothetical protein
MLKNMNNFSQNYTLNHAAKGRVRIWSHSAEKGFERLIYDAPNMITYTGARIAAQCLAGVAGSSINQMYIGYGSDNPVTTPAITDTCASFNALETAIVPLSFSPTFGNSTSSYINNEVFFTVFLTGTVGSGAPLNQGTGAINTINMLGLVNNGPYGPLLFSRIAVTPSGILYNQNLAISWGITFTAS